MKMGKEIDRIMDLLLKMTIIAIIILCFTKIFGVDEVIIKIIFGIYGVIGLLLLLFGPIIIGIYDDCQENEKNKGGEK